MLQKYIRNEMFKNGAYNLNTLHWGKGKRKSVTFGN